jgi:hypothetical protein
MMSDSSRAGGRRQPRGSVMGNDRRRSSCLGRGLRVGFSAVAVIVATLAVWALVNVPPPAAPVVRDYLTPRDLQLAVESQHLRTSLGERLWPGFQLAALPLQLYNERFGFVLGMPAPPGWHEVTEGRYQGSPYYRTDNPERQAFAVRVGDRWAGSLAVKEMADAELPRLFRRKSGILARLIPYRLFATSTDQYVGLLLHEQFHAFQAERNGRRFDRATSAYTAGARYPWDDPRFRQAWMDETKLLLGAAAATDRAARVGEAARFLASRRSRQRLLPDVGALAFERELEWLEGLAKYVELTSWRLAGQTGYAAVPSMRGDPGFHGYRGYASHWAAERMTMRIGGSLRGDLPFYYSGAVQAMLLDELDSGWKTGFLESDRFLDDRLGDAIEQRR